MLTCDISGVGAADPCAVARSIQGTTGGSSYYHPSPTVRRRDRERVSRDSSSSIDQGWSRVFPAHSIRGWQDGKRPLARTCFQSLGCGREGHGGPRRATRTSHSYSEGFTWYGSTSQKRGGFANMRPPRFRGSLAQDHRAAAPDIHRCLRLGRPERRVPQDGSVARNEPRPKATEDRPIRKQLAGEGASPRRK